MKRSTFFSFFFTRVYSRFHKKSIPDLDQEGINKLCQLLMVIAINVEKSDVLTRLFNLLGLISFNQKTLIFKKNYIFHYFTLLALLRSTKVDTTAVYSRLSDIFKAISTSITHQKANKQHQQSVNLLMFYFQQVQQFFEESWSDLEEKDLLLICSDVYKNVLRTIPDVHKNTLYKHLDQLVLVFITHNHSQRMKQAAFQKFHDSFPEPLLNLLLNQGIAHVDKLMEIVANLTVLAIQR